MIRTISAYEAPALMDAHGGLTRLALYERLAGSPEAPPQAGLAAAISDDVVGFVARMNGWTKTIGRKERFDIIENGSIQGYANYWTTSDEQGEFIVTFVHVASYLFSSRWRRAGSPPADYVIQAQWAMMAAGSKRLAVVALADKTPEVFWIDADEGIMAALRAGAADMSRRLEAKDPPPVDSETGPVDTNATRAAEEALASVTDPDAVIARFRAAKIGRSEKRSEVQFADHEYDVAEKALMAILAPGASREYDGFRITRNAKNDRITEEKIDGLYF
jgi:hypothetical protein